ncbi:Sec7-domain-containing protein [Rhizoclosmatium globosum]|uniref:Sec7-domain-containing protein n=1 Tax=Rhizoclosmatium globosum TaxID=329046 RepID=A0A1Y2BTQ2_9FUNG|nr:Sec7-domain-containing protein [Rhizoclosmatium globosum]|eukprot:ORY38126.1 Sec7-domain-containing protein [Rhizoclosmatium globosum]
MEVPAPASPGTPGTGPSPHVFLRIALDQIGATPEAKKVGGLLDAVTAAKGVLVTLEGKPLSFETAKVAEAQASRLFLPLKICCVGKVGSLAAVAVDCLGKTLQYNYWTPFLEAIGAEEEEDAIELKEDESEDASAFALAQPQPTSGSETEQNKAPNLLSQIVNAICDAPGAATTDSSAEDKVHLQVVKALGAAVLAGQSTAASTTTTQTHSRAPSFFFDANDADQVRQLKQRTVHGQVLLRALRTTFNVFLLSRSPATQIVAQAALTQMIQSIFGRVPKGFALLGSASLIADSESSEEDATQQLQQLYPNGTTMPDVDAATLAVFDTNVKDCFLVFRALCKVGMKPLPNTEGIDLKSVAMRSKLLSLHLLHTIMCSHLHIFYLNTPFVFSWEVISTLPDPSTNPHVDISTPTLFIHAVKPYLMLTTTRNAVSIVPQVFDVSMELFGQTLLHLRVFLKSEIAVLVSEILLPILESKSTLITFHQRTSLLKILTSILTSESGGGKEGRLLVDMYLNYDCDPETTSTRENLWERFVTLLSRVITTPGKSDPQSSPSTAHTQQLAAATANTIGATKNTVIRPMTTQALTSYTKEQLRELYSTSGDFGELRKRGVEVLVRGVLGPVVSWGWDKWVKDTEEGRETARDVVASTEVLSNGVGEEGGSTASLLLSPVSWNALASDDPLQFEELRLRKQTLLEGIKKFNEKPKKGIQYLLENRAIASRTPTDIASFLLTTEGLDKNMIGEFLGEGNDENIAIMHAFVDLQDFTSVPFVAALRSFLQHFRLPGEAQKIDRFMLKFAERYLQGNPGQFSSADTAYVLSYSVIMLNTDQHNPQVKKRMTKADFLKNNRGIDGDQDLPVDFMEGIFDEIRNNEIVLKDEQPATDAATAAAANIPANQRFEKAAANMAQKTEERLKARKSVVPNASNGGSQDDLIVSNFPGNSGTFYTATHYEHVKSMFEIVWMSVFTALRFKHAITIACMFDMDLERKAFLSTLNKFAQLSGTGEVKAKNLEAVRVLLEVSRSLGGRLGDGWMEIVLCISDLEKMNTGEDGSPVTNGRASVEKARASNGHGRRANLTSSVKLSGPAIVGFVKALCAVSWDEITSSENSQHPRMYCLQRLLWAILGQHFNQVAAHKNSQVSFFALDKLRQLAIKFLELDELQSFKFQRDFLKPFEYVLGNSRDPKMKDMALTCLQQMIQGKSKAIKSGWKTMFATFARAARDDNEQVVSLAFDMIKMIFKSHFDEIISNGAFPDFVTCLVAFCKNNRFAKTGLHSVELLKQTVPRIFDMLKTTSGSKVLESTAPKTKAELLSVTTQIMNSSNSSANLPLPNHNNEKTDDSADTPEETSFRYIFPVLFGFHEVIMSCDLEVRARGLGYLFDLLKIHGTEFSHDSWEVIAKGAEHKKMDEREDLTVWLSTTLIQALRQMVDLFTYHFEILRFGIDGFFDILVACMTQENETLARIGSTCLHQFIENNLDKFDEKLWDRICQTFQSLFSITTPNLLFFDYHEQVPEAPSGVMAPPEAQVPVEEVDRDVGSESMAQHMQSVTSLTGTSATTNEVIFIKGVPQLEGRPKPVPEDFQGIILKCVLHLLVVQTLHEILTTSVNKSSANITEASNMDERIYRAFHYRFAEAMGFMKQLPNLLKQECASVIAYISILFKMVMDTQADRQQSRGEVAGLLIPLCHQVLHNFNTMEPGIKNRNVNAWKPVEYLPRLFEETTGILLQPELDLEIRIALHAFVIRCGSLFGVVGNQEVVPSVVGGQAEL